MSGPSMPAPAAAALSPAADEADFDVLHGLGVAAFNAGDAGRAEQLLRYALALRPSHANVLANLGATLAALGRVDEAIAVLERAVSIAPESFGARTNLAAALRLKGAHEAALAEYETSATLAPDNPAGRLNVAGMLRELRRPEQALPHLQQLVAMAPEHAGAWHLLGDTLCLLGRREEAAQAASRLAALSPGNASAYWNLSGVLSDLGRHEEALDAARRAVELAPQRGESHGALARALRCTRRWDEAITAGRQALELSPADAMLHHGLGVALAEVGREADAEAAYQEALRLKPDLADALVNLGRLRRDPDEAVALYRRALEIAPGHETALFNLSLSLLAKGHFDEGWAGYEYRHKAAGNPPPPEFPAPLWMGEDLAGKTIVLLPEQGLGDQIQCARYAPLLREQGARVLLLVQPELERLLREACLADEVYSGGALPRADFKLPIMSLPHRFGTGEKSVPFAEGYLPLSADRRPEERAASLRVGIVWQGSRLHHNDRNRSVPLSHFEGLALPGLELVSLQVGPAAQAAADHPFIRPPGIPLRDFADTAAVVSGLDLVLCVDTSVAHLAGAMGRTVWLLLPEPCDWRWLRERTDSPWYDSMRIFRQKTPGDWDGVFRQVRHALRKHLVSRAMDDGTAAAPMRRRAEERRT